MLCITLPGGGTIPATELELEHLVCDVNGTLAEDGLLIEGVTGRLTELARHLRIHLLTADTYETLEVITSQLRMAAVEADVAPPQWTRVSAGEQKAAYVRELGLSSVVAVGNGANDVAMFALARLSIAVLGAEGLNVRASQAATVLSRSINDALDLLLFPQRLVATLHP